MACSKIFSADIPELLNDIVQNFQNDFKTLHSCILVNRLWCRLTIPLLWESSFSIFRLKRHSNVSSHKFRFLEIYLHYLNDGDKKRLLEEYRVDSSSNLFPTNTLFNYPNFIKRLNVKEIFDA